MERQTLSFETFKTVWPEEFARMEKIHGPLNSAMEINEAMKRETNVYLTMLAARKDGRNG